MTIQGKLIDERETETETGVRDRDDRRQRQRQRQESETETETGDRDRDRSLSKEDRTQNSRYNKGSTEQLCTSGGPFWMVWGANGA